MRTRLACIVALCVSGSVVLGQGGPCIEAIMAEVLDQGTTEGVDVGCVAGTTASAFRMPEPAGLEGAIRGE